MTNFKEYSKSYRERNRQRINQRTLQLYWANHDKKIEYRRAWYNMNKSVINQKRRAKYKQSRDIYYYTW